MWTSLAWIPLLVLNAAAQREGTEARSERAARAMIEERFAEAENLYKSLLEADPGNSGLLLNLGLAQQSLGKYGEAAAQFRAVVKLQPEATLPWLLLGVAERKLNRPSEAVAPLEHVLAAEPANRAAAIELAEALFELGRWEEAAARFFRFVEMEPSSAGGWQGLGTCYVRLARQAGADLHKLAPRSGYAFALAGRERAESGKLEMAYAFYREALKREPDLRGVRRAIAEIYQATGNPEWAKLEEAREEKLRPADCRKNTAECEVISERYWQAVEASKSESGARSIYWKALAYYELSSIAFARLAEQPLSAELYMRLAEVHRLLGRHGEAVKSWQEAVTLVPDDRELQKKLARSLIDSGDHVAARRILERLAAAEPGSQETNVMLGEVLRALGQPDRAQAYLDRAKGWAAEPNWRAPALPGGEEIEKNARITPP